MFRPTHLLFGVSLRNGSGVAIDDARVVQHSHQRAWMAVPGVFAVGLKPGPFGLATRITVTAEALTPAIRKAIPSSIDGVPVDLIQSDRAYVQDLAKQS